MLINVFKAEQLKQRSYNFRHHPDTDALAGRVREIARSALNMSEFELDEFFDSTSSTYQVVSELIKITVLVGFNSPFSVPEGYLHACATLALLLYKLNSLICLLKSFAVYSPIQRPLNP